MFDTSVSPEVEYTDSAKLASLGISVSCGEHSEDVGEYNLVGACTNGNYDVSFTGKLTITPASVTVELPYVETLYGDEVSHDDLANQVTAEGPISDGDLAAVKDTLSCECGGTGTPNAGTYQISAYVPDSVKANKNYTVSIKGPSENGMNGVHCIAPRETLVSIDSVSKIYGQDDPGQFTYKIYDASGEAAVPYSDEEAEAIAKALNIQITREPGEDVGNYALKGAWTPNGNYLLSFNVDAKLTVTQADVTVILSDIESICGEEASKDDHAAGATVAGPISDEDKAAVLEAVSCECDCSASAKVGAYAITADVPESVEANPNYRVTVKPGTHTVVPRVDVSADSEGGTVASDVKGGPQGTVINVEATPDEGYVFDGWTLLEGDGIIADAKAAKTTITVGTLNAVVKAKFAKKPDEPVGPVDPVDPVDPGTDPGQGGGPGSVDSSNGANAAPDGNAEVIDAQQTNEASTAATASKTGDSLAGAAVLIAVIGAAAAAAAYLALRRARKGRKH